MPNSTVAAPLAGCAALLAATTLFAAEVYPAKLVKIVVPFAAGGSTDLLTRSVAQQLSEAWKRPVVVENRAGGGGVIGSEYVVKSPADGYTLLLGTNTTHAVAATLYSKLPYDLRRDFTPITEIASIPLILSVHPSIPVKSVRDLVALARAKPGDLNHGGGIGAAAHMAMALFESMAQIKVTQVPYKGSGPAMIDLLGGHLSLGFDALMTTLPHAQSGKLRTLAASSLKRSPVAPQIPTLAEAGYPGYEAILWFGLFGPAGLPVDTVKKINEETARGLAAPRMREMLASQGLEIVASSPVDFTGRVEREIIKWRKVILDARIRLE